MKIRQSFDQIITVILVFLTIVINILADALPINGVSTAEISDSIAIYFVPAGYVFAIWGLIYIGLVAFAYYQFNPKATNAKWLKPVYNWFFIGSIANMTWIFLWHYQQIELSVVAMLTLLVSLIMMYRILEIGSIDISGPTKWMVHAPISLYLGWISVATIANIAGALHINKWGGFGIDPQLWAAIMIAIAAGLTVVMVNLRKDYIYAGVVIWALIGIWAKFPQDGTIVAAIIAALIAIAATVISKNLGKAPKLTGKRK